MNIEMNIEGAKQARKTIRFMAMGFMPSQENANNAADLFKEYAASDDAQFNPKTAIKVARSIAMGAVASESMCAAAVVEIDLMIDSMREIDSQTIRSNYRERY